MHVLITGNLGYVGPLVVRRLREALPDAVLTGLDTGYFAHCVIARDALAETLLDRQHYADLRDFDPSLLAGVDAVVHLAGISNDPMGNRYEEVTRAINHDAGVRLARLSRDAGVARFVFASSCSLYGFAEEGERTEDSPLQPLTAYARSKASLELALREMAGPGFRVTSLRFATACGMSERLRLDLVLNDFVAAAVTSRRITILSDGTPWRPLIAVSDMARAVEWALGRGPESGHELAVNAGRDEWNFQVRDLAAAVARVLPGVTVEIASGAVPDRRSYRVSFARYRALAPAHQPVAKLDDVIRDIATGLESFGFTDATFRESRFMRLRALEALRAGGRLGDDLRWSARTRVTA
jgi:nucleoside-diphosphate-sugar epimerase